MRGKLIKLDVDDDELQRYKKYLLLMEFSSASEDPLSELPKFNYEYPVFTFKKTRLLGLTKIPVPEKVPLSKVDQIDFLPYVRKIRDTIKLDPIDA
jgi:hypothetical protein